MELNRALVLFCGSCGIASFYFLAVGAFPFRMAILIALDFWMAAGLIKLSGNPTWATILTVGAIIVIRKMAGISLSHSPSLKALVRSLKQSF